MNDSSHQVRPCDFRLYLLTKSVLQAYLRRLQLRDFRIQPVALLRFRRDFGSNLVKGTLENVSHGYAELYTYCA